MVLLAESVFTSLLMKWHVNENTRKMPWKGIRDPYKIWLSEIMLQQTRVEQGERYYLAFTSAFPTILDLARAADDEVFRLWQGLGYYSRCRNMLATARQIAFDRQGVFPSTYPEILALKGVGDYSAAAIASMAFQLPYAVVDGNVVRVLSRVFAMNVSAFDAKGKKIFREKAQALLDLKKPGQYNQAIMDLGATVCTPRQPRCSSCPLGTICIAFRKNELASYPVRKIRTPLQNRTFHFLLFESRQEMVVGKRTGKDIWKDLHAFYTIESDKLRAGLLPAGVSMKQLGKPETLTQILSHQKITGHFYRIRLAKADLPRLPGFITVRKEELGKLAFPKMIVSFLEKNHYL